MTTTPDAPAAPLPTYDEAIESLTGYEEEAIVKKFGTDIDSLRTSMQLRALIFTFDVRNGDEQKAAYEHAMSLPAKAFLDHFSSPDDVDDVMPDEPVSAVGEDDTSGE